MDRLQSLIAKYGTLLGSQPDFEDLITELSEGQAERLASRLAVFVRHLKSGWTYPPFRPTIH